MLEERAVVASDVLAPGLIVVDTDVVSFLFRQDTRAERYRPHLAHRVPVISAQTRAELYLWPEVRNWGARRRRELEGFLRGYPVEYPDDEICRCHAELTAEALHRGFPLPTADAWHAATASVLGVPLVTHNGGHFRGIRDPLVISEPDR